MVYGFAQQSGGTLRIDSVVGRGTCMEIWLPRAPVGLSDERVPAGDPETMLSPSGAESLRILLVDDNADVRRVTAEMLKDAGHRVTEVKGGAEALALLQDAPDDHDLVVTDYAMPLVSGLEVIRLTRNLRPTMPALLITGYADLESLSSRPADVCVLAKPFGPEALTRAVQDCTTALADG
jgi:CheY-like chemotaxis protein